MTSSDEPKREAEGEGENQQPDADAQGTQPETGATETTGAGDAAAEGAAKKDEE